MLNKDSQRELAYVVTIDDIKPIEGADRVETAIVGGWRIMVRKDQFKPGDPAIYFEIDSRLPETEAFKFMEAKGYKVKTQKYFKGTVISQGLLMGAEDFGWKVENGVIIDDEGKMHTFINDSRFLTEQLGVTYYDPADVKRKADPVAIQPRRGKKVWKWLMKRSWGRWILGKLNLQGSHKEQWPEWVKKSDEERCLAGKTKIATDHGDILLSTIVNKQLPVKVRSFNQDTGQIEYKEITSYQKYSVEENELLDIEFIQYKKGDTKRNRVVCTGDHKFYVDGNYVKASELKVGDKLARLSFLPDERCHQFLYGMLLGDGSITYDKRRKISRAKFQYCQGVDHNEYFELIKDAFGVEKEYLCKSGYTNDYSIRKICFSDAAIESNLINMNSIVDHKFKVTKEFCDSLSEAAIAVWYMDDGTIRHRDEAWLGSSLEISSNAFSESENELLADMLRTRFGISCRVKYDSTRGFYSIYINTDGAKAFCNLIASYVPECMRYKLTQEADSSIPFNRSLWPDGNCEYMNVSTEIVDIKPFVNHTNGYHIQGSVYDIEVADNHNFYANGILTHNCQNMPWVLEDKSPWVVTEKIDGTSTTFAMKRNKWPHKNDYYVCSRNVVLYSANQKAYYDTPKNYYWEMADKYNMKEVLEDLLKRYPTANWVYIQGETYGSGVQKRDYSIKGRDLAVFNLVLSHCGRLDSVTMKEVLSKYNVPCVPILEEEYILPDTVDDLLNYAEGNSMIDCLMREGVVLRSQDGQRSFKAVSNKYLMKYHG